LLSTIGVLLASLVGVFIASLLFVNALEWLGSRLKLGSSFVGAVLAPIFTSLPELIVILVAIFSNMGEAGQEVGIGTIFGEPFMASGLSYSLVGIAVILGYFAKKRGSTTLVIDKTLSIPYIFIVILFPLVLIPGFVHVVWLKYLFGVGPLVVFVFYMRLMYRRRAAEEVEGVEDLTFERLAPGAHSHPTVALAFQLSLSVALLYFGARYLVSSVVAISQGINVSPLGLAVIIIPAATVLPETIAALIWGYRGKDTLSIGSLVGEKALYSTFYPALGLFLTSWVLDIHAVYSVIATTVISLVLLYYVRKQRLPWYALFFGFAFFTGYAVLIFVFRI
jgi:cation:H+ antiporter